MSYTYLGQDENQGKAIEEAMTQAVNERPSIREEVERYRCVIFTTQTVRCGNPYDCFVYKHYSPEQLVDKVGVEGAERLFNGFTKAIQG